MELKTHAKEVATAIYAHCELLCWVDVSSGGALAKNVGTKCDKI